MFQKPTNSTIKLKLILVGLLNALILSLNAQTNTFPPSGNVGIGTTSPASNLQVIGTIQANNSSGTTNNGVFINAGNTNTAGSINVNRLRFGGNDANALYFTIQGPNNVDYLTINNGSVGIGTTTPTTKLHVVGSTTSNTINLNESGTKIGFLSRGASVTSGWAATPDILAITYWNRDFAIGGWGKSDGVWKGASIYINSDNSYVGIGTTTPGSKLEVTGKIRSTGISSGSGSFEATNVQNGNVYFNTNTVSGNGIINLNRLDGSTVVYLNSFGASYFNGGNVLIGKTSQTNTNYNLDVNGNVRANKIVVNTTGADYVFDSSYKLLSLEGLSTFIQQNHHLPQIASAIEMKTNGVDLGENQTKLLQKTEELSLYLIQQNKIINNQNSKIDQLESQIKFLQQSIEALNSKLDNKQ